MPNSPLASPAETTRPATTASSRRALLRGGAVLAGAGAGAVALGAPAEAAGAARTRYRPAHHRGAPLLGDADHHLVTRFSYGVTPTLTRQVRAAGGARAWFDEQVAGFDTPDPAVQSIASWWPSLFLSPQELWDNTVSGAEDGWFVMANYQRWLMVRRITTARPVAEVMAEFWMNHLHVPVHADGVFTWRYDYDQVVRRHALGRFEDLLKAAVLHPAMGMYLNNAVSTKDHPNENLGRELLELHTVGRIYSEDDVKSSARILTGYLVDMWDTWQASYSPDDHWTGPVSVLGFSSPNGARDGRAVTGAYLSYLAHHRSTAERIATKLAVKFVGDDPSDALVSHLADVYLANDTAIVPVLRALIDSSQFAAQPVKVRDPVEDVVATYRALHPRVSKPGGGEDDDSAAMAMLWQADSIGALPHDWPRPDGAPIDNLSWSSPSRMMASTSVHWVMSGTWWPARNIAYRTPMQWMPSSRLRFDLLVDHLSQQLLGKRSTATLLKACCQACELKPSSVVDRRSDLVKWKFGRLLSTILDSPAHLTR